jgi:hypothetical protein
MHRVVLISVLVVAAAATVLGGCAGARPWRRETLADPRMQFGADPDAEILEQHVYQYREGSAGGYGGTGGGCGCN